MGMRNFYRRLINFYHRRHYYLHRFNPVRRTRPFCTLELLVNGTVFTRIGSTGLTIVDNFCTTDEAKYLINHARTHIQQRQHHSVSDTSPHISVKQSYKVIPLLIGDALIPDYRSLHAARTLDGNTIDSNETVAKLIRRAGAILNLPVVNVEGAAVTQYEVGDFYGPHVDYFATPGFNHDRTVSMLVYLNTLTEEQGGFTEFHDLNTRVAPLQGRAIFWTNKDLKSRWRPETVHSSAVVRDGEKWIFQLFWRDYPVFCKQPAILSDEILVSALTEKDTHIHGVSVIRPESK